MGVTETGMAFMPYGPRWRAHRKLFNDFISPSTANNYDANQVKVISNFLVNLYQNPEAFKEHINLCVFRLFAMLVRLITMPHQPHWVASSLDCIWDPGRNPGKRVLYYV